MSLSGAIRSRPLSRIVGFIFILATLLTLPACWVESINPLYEQGFFTSKDPDVVFEPRLTGSWTAILDKCTILLTISAKDDIYD